MFFVTVFLLFITHQEAIGVPLPHDGSACSLVYSEPSEVRKNQHRKFIGASTKFIAKTPQSSLLIELQMIHYYLTNPILVYEGIFWTENSEDLEQMAEAMDRLHGTYGISRKSRDLSEPKKDLTDLIDSTSGWAMERLMRHAYLNAPVVLGVDLYHRDRFSIIDEIFLDPELRPLRERLLKLGTVLDTFFKSREADRLFRQHREYYRSWRGDREASVKHLKQVQRKAVGMIKAEALRQGYEAWEIKLIDQLVFIPQ